MTWFRERDKLVNLRCSWNTYKDPRPAIKARNTLHLGESICCDRRKTTREDRDEVKTSQSRAFKYSDERLALSAQRMTRHTASELHVADTYYRFSKACTTTKEEDLTML